MSKVEKAAEGLGVVVEFVFITVPFAAYMVTKLMMHRLRNHSAQV